MSKTSWRDQLTFPLLTLPTQPLLDSAEAWPCTCPRVTSHGAHSGVCPQRGHLVKGPNHTVPCSSDRRGWWEQRQTSGQTSELWDGPEDPNPNSRPQGADLEGTLSSICGAHAGMMWTSDWSELRSSSRQLWRATSMWHPTRMLGIRKSFNDTTPQPLLHKGA